MRKENRDEFGDRRGRGGPAIATTLRAAASSEPAFTLTEPPRSATFEDGHEASATVTGTGATAVVAYTDMAAFGALSGPHEPGVPGDVSLTGFDDIPFAHYTTLPLTTASIPRNGPGGQAWARPWARLNGEPGGHSTHFQPRLIVRDSTGPAR